MFLEHQNELFHGFIGCKKSFDRVYHDSHMGILKDNNIDNRLIEVIEVRSYDEATSAVLLNGSVVDFFSNDNMSATWMSIVSSRLLFNAGQDRA